MLQKLSCIYCTEKRYWSIDAHRCSIAHHVLNILDGLDGQLARQTGQVTRWGDYLDHTLDRLLDAMWVIAIASSTAWVDDPVLGWAAAWFTLLGSYMGTQAQAVSGGVTIADFHERIALS